jgi:hypothetical protein
LALPLSQAKALDLLAKMHHVATEKRTALRSRLQHFQRLRFPVGVNTGRGKPADYGVGSVAHLVIAFQLLEFGMGPERVVKFFLSQDVESRIANDLGAVAEILMKHDLNLSGPHVQYDEAGLDLIGAKDSSYPTSEEDQYYLVIIPNALISLHGDKKILSGFDGYSWSGRGPLTKDEYGATGQAIINLTNLFHRVLMYLSGIDRDAASKFLTELLEWSKIPRPEWQGPVRVEFVE